MFSGLHTVAYCRSGRNETVRQRDLPSLHSETRKTAVGGRVLPPLAGLSVLSSNHLQTAVLALLRHQLNW